MKKIGLVMLTLSLAFLSVSCKKEKSPELEITVVNSEKNPVRGYWVRVSAEGANLGDLDPRLNDSVRTDNFGKAFFDFDNTVLIDVYTYLTPNQNLDSLSILLETKRKKKSEDNSYERTMVVP